MSMSMSMQPLIIIFIITKFMIVVIRIIICFGYATDERIDERELAIDHLASAPSILFSFCCEPPFHLGTLRI